VIVAVQKETCPGERRVALTPHGVSQVAGLGLEVHVQAGAGEDAFHSDDEYRTSGATVIADRSELFNGAQLILQVRGLGANPERGREDLQLLSKKQTVIALHDPLGNPQAIAELAERGVTVLALETIPRISRAQTMDVLSSMATIAGYKAVLLAAASLPKLFPMLMTAAGTLTGSRVFVLGAGVAGLQALATARRLGAVVQGYDIRPAAAEQIKSMGAKVVEIPLAEGAGETEDQGGYARQQSEDFLRRQREHLGKVVAGSDVVITTAAVPGARSPILVTTEMVDGMAAGSVVVDLAAERGGNCELTRANETVVHHGVTILGPTELAASIPFHASQMFSNNLTSLLKHLTKEGTIVFDLEDEITRDTTVARDGEVLHPAIRAKLGLSEAVLAASGSSEK
jgi:proton-translocating NAD(P)+ transhydrogenase subunit alpha